MAWKPDSGKRSLPLGIAASAGAAFLLLLGAAVCNQTSAHAPKPPPSRQVTQLSGLIASDLPTGSQFYVAANGRTAATGSLHDPWDLSTALAQPAAVKPGDTLWLRGGTYAGSFTSDLTGLSGAPVTVRQYPGERATLDGAGLSGGRGILTVKGAYAVYRDFEVFSSTNPNPNGGQGTRPDGIQATGPNTKFINLVIHDTGQGFSHSESASDSEVSGCLIYYNGNSQLDHGIYAQNLTGSKWLLDNIFFRNYGFGIHAYATGGHLNNFNIEGNVSFANGKLNPTMPYKSNILLGAGGSAATSCTSSPQVAQNPRLVSNYTYHPRGTGGREMDLGYSTGSCNPTATGNYLVGDTTLNLGPAFGTIAITDNTFYGSVAGFSSTSYPNSNYLASRPTGAAVFLRQNRYEAGRANIVIYNWDLTSAVDVDLTGVLTVGSTYEIRNAQDYFGAPVVTGTYAGGTVSLPMAGLSIVTPVGVAAPPATGPEFNAFVLLVTRFGRMAPELPKPSRPGTRVLERHP